MRVLIFFKISEEKGELELEDQGHWPKALLDGEESWNHIPEGNIQPRKPQGS